MKKLTSAAFAAAFLASPGLLAPSPPPSVLPGVLDVIFCGTGAVVALFCGADPNTLPGVWKLSGLFSDFEHRFPIVDRSVEHLPSSSGRFYSVSGQLRRVCLNAIACEEPGDVSVLGETTFRASSVWARLISGCDASRDLPRLFPVLGASPIVFAESKSTTA
jgi:hypothetical protein